MNTLDRRDNPSALNLPNGANLEESLPKTVRILTARDSSMFTNIPVIWEIPETYEQASKREQSFTVNGTLDLSGTDIVVLPEQESLQTVTVEVTVAGAPQYRVTATSSENGTVTVTNFAKTAEDGTPLFCKDEFVMLSIAPDEGYMLSALSINGTPAAVAVGEDTYTFAQPEEDVTITATFEKRNEHTVTFDAGDGTPSVGSMTTTNQKLSSLPSASRSKHSFNGWYTEKNGGTKVTTDTVFSANTTVYAHWTYTGGGYYYPPVTYYTLRFETGGGSDISSVQGTYNAYIDLAQYVPTWRGHTFTGWYSERSLTNKVSGVYLTKDKCTLHLRSVRLCGTIHWPPDYCFRQEKGTHRFLEKQRGQADHGGKSPAAYPLHWMIQLRLLSGAGKVLQKIFSMVKPHFFFICWDDNKKAEILSSNLRFNNYRQYSRKYLEELTQCPTPNMGSHLAKGH